MESNFQILTGVITPSDRAVFLEDLRCLEQFYYHVDFSQGTHGTPPGLSYLYGRQLLAFLSTQKDSVGCLKEFRTLVESFELATLTIGFVPTAVEADKILKNARNVIGHNILVDLQIDKNLMGGIRLACKGKYIDLGLANLIDKYFETHKTDWLGRLKLI